MRVRAILDRIRRYARRHPDVVAMVIMMLFVVGCNSIYLTITNQDPLIGRSGLSIVGKEHVLPGQNTIDPNDGFTSQALGVGAVDQITSGTIPYWNHYEGIGFPLLGGMQSAALFPFTFLLKLSGGSLLFHMSLELVAALGVYFLIKQLGFRRRIAVVAGCLFAVNGTFVWLTNAAFNPVPFLPWLLFGIEKVRTESKNATKRCRGWFIIAFALALSLYAGFPETAYLDALLAVVWALVRLKGLERNSIKCYATSLTRGGVIGVLLALPVLVAFITYLPNAYVGSHDSTTFGNAYLPFATLPALVMPYVYGPIFTFAQYDTSHVISAFWSNVGGYVGTGTAVLACIGLIWGKKYKGLKITLAVWIGIFLARSYGMPGIKNIVNMVPGMSQTAVFRYIMPSVELAILVLACFGAEALLNNQIKGNRRKVITAGCVFVGIWLIWMSSKQLALMPGAPRHSLIAALSILMAIGVTTTIIAAMYMRTKWVTYAAISFAVIEGALLFVLPQLSAPAHTAKVDLAPVQFLKTHLGNERFFTLGPIAPNYGTYFKIASINNNDLPIPKLWAEYVTRKLDPGTEPILFMGSFTDDPSKSSKAEFFEHLSAYENVSVKYIVSSKDQITAEESLKYSLRLVYKDTGIEIYSLPKTIPYITTEHPCELSSLTRDTVHLRCSEATLLTRRELYFPGWKVSVNGKTQQITKDDIFQRVEVPKGESTIQFDFRPPYIEWAWGGFWIGVASMTLLLVLQPIRPKQKHKVQKH